MPRFTVAVFKHETNTFSPIPTPWSAFGRYNPEPGPVSDTAALTAYRGTSTPVGAYIDLAEECGAELQFAIAANATPGGPAPDCVIDEAASAVIEAVRRGCDALFLDLHGGMVTEGHADPEGELLRRIRSIAPNLPIAVSLDFHSALSRATIDNATVISGYQTYPHVDTYQTGMRAGRILLRVLAGEIDPVILWHSLPILSHLNCQTPSRQPMKDIMDLAIAATADGTVLDASVFGGFPLADIPHVGMHGIVIADRPTVERGRDLLRELMRLAWERRREFEFVGEPVAESIARAKGIQKGPVVLADHGDVAGSGGSTDVMTVLAEVLRQDLHNVCAGPFWDPKAVAEMASAGAGAEITLKLGGRTDFPAIGEKGEPLTIQGVVRRVTEGAFTVTCPMKTGARVSLGRTGVIDTGNVEILVSEQRHEPFDIGCFTQAGIEPASKQYILLKSRQHFRAGFEQILSEVVMVAGPGVCTSEYTRFPWRNLRRPIFPLDPEATADLP